MSKSANTPDDIPAPYLICRAFAHEPRFITDHLIKQRGKVVAFIHETKCEKCSTVVKRVINLDGTMERPSYTYPDRYRVKGGYAKDMARMDYAREHYGLTS